MIEEKIFMKIINGKHWFQVKDLILHLVDMPKESIVSVEGRPIYKVVETAEPGEVYLYLGDK